MPRLGPRGSKFYKMGTFAKAGLTVIVSVIPQARTIVRLEATSGSTPLRDEAVTYRACPTGAASSWVGGFGLTGAGRSAARFPMEIRIKGEAWARPRGP